MDNFPEFMRNHSNKIALESQYTKGIEGYLYDGADGSQMAIWICQENASSVEHVHDYDEYIVVLQGRYTIIFDEEKVSLSSGDEYVIPKGIAHGGEVVAGTRVINAFGGQRAKRENITLEKR